MTYSMKLVSVNSQFAILEDKDSHLSVLQIFLKLIEMHFSWVITDSSIDFVVPYVSWLFR